MGIFGVQILWGEIPAAADRIGSVGVAQEKGTRVSLKMTKSQSVTESAELQR